MRGNISARGVLALLAIFCLTASSAQAGIVLVSDNPFTGAAWAIDDTYRLAFVTSGTRDATDADIAGLTRQLGSKKVAERKEAHAALIRIGRPAEARLLAATKDANLERARRAELALQEIEAARFQVRLASVEQLWTPGDAPRVRLEVRNIGDQPMRLMPLKHRGRLLNAGFRVRMLGESEAGSNCGSQIAEPVDWAALEPVVVRPGEVLTVENSACHRLMAPRAASHAKSSPTTSLLAARSSTRPCPCVLETWWSSGLRQGRLRWARGA